MEAGPEFVLRSVWFQGPIEMKTGVRGRVKDIREKTGASGSFFNCLLLSPCCPYPRAGSVLTMAVTLLLFVHFP